MEQLTSFITERPYVLAFLASFLVISTAERGWLRTVFWLASGTFLGWLMEFSSVRTGFPFGAYSYHEENFPDELFIGGVPVFASLSFAFMTYFGYSVACTFLSPLDNRGAAIERRAGTAIELSWQALLLAAVITTWVDTVIDPVSLLGEHWFLGDLYAYEDDGIHFGVPLANYAGWLFTSALIVFVNQRLDAWLRGRERARVRGFHLPYKPLWALGAVLGNFAFMLSITMYLVTSDDVPSSASAGEVLLSGALLSGAFVVFAAVMLGRALAKGAVAVAR